MDNVPLTIQALISIKNIKENKGFIECPKCKGKLSFYRSIVNGHTRGKCETENCISWIE